jgi:OOP family OmpA-OmpF porin
MQTMTSTRLLIAASLIAVFQPAAFAAEPVAGYWTNRYGETIMGGSGECLRNNDKVTEYRQECGYELVTGEAASVDTGDKGTAVTVAKSAAIVKGDEVKASATVIEQVVIRNVEFAFDSAELEPGFATMLDNASDFLKPHRPLLRDGLAQLNVIGYTDSRGPAEYNQALSVRRAQAVADHLIKQDPSRAAFIKVMGRGESEPIASNDTEEGRQQNRRVVLQVIGK